MKTIRLIATLICLIFGAGCCNRGPFNFHFQLIGETFSYDSRNQHYARAYARGDSSIKLTLTSQELRSIFKYVRQVDFLDFPKEFGCTPTSDRRLPAFGTTIKLGYDFRYNEVSNSDFCSEKVDQKRSDQFEDLVARILQILNSKEQIKNLKDSDLIFM